MLLLHRSFYILVNKGTFLKENISENHTDNTGDDKTTFITIGIIIYLRVSGTFLRPISSRLILWPIMNNWG